MNIAHQPQSSTGNLPPDRPWSPADRPLSPPDSRSPSAYYPPRSPAPVGAPGLGPRNPPTPPESAGANGINGYMNGSAAPKNGMNGYAAPNDGMNGYMNGMGGRPGGGGGGYGGSAGAPSPPASVGRMSNGTQMSSSEAQRHKQSMMEDSLNQHYTVLKRYLGNVLQEDPNTQKSNRARDKLVRLSSVQFQELSTDVYDELRRRQAQERGANAPNALPPRDNFHPKRNQARQKLSTLPSDRFSALASDVFFELDRRFPRFSGGNLERVGSPRLAPPQRIGSPGFMGPDARKDMGRRMDARDAPYAGNDRLRPAGMLPKQSQSNTAVPNKSYLVEEDDGDLDSVYNKRDTTTTSKSNAASDKLVQEYQTQIEELNRKVERLETRLEDSDRFTQDKIEELKTKDRQLQDKDDEIDRLEERNRSSARNNDAAEQEWSGLRKNLEAKVADAEALKQNLQSEIDRIKAQNSEREDDLRNQIDVMARKNNDGGEWRMRFNEMQQEQTKLKRDNQDLQEQLRKQQTSTQSVRRELEGFLAEMKTIVDQSEGSLHREEGLQQQVKGLEAELRMWRNRCAKMKTQLGQADTIALHQPDVLKEAFVRPDGLIQYVHVTGFQLAVDELLRIARARDTAALLETLRTMVVAVKDICDDVPSNAPGQAGQQRTKVSAMANNLITATKNFAAAKGLSPVSLVDAAAANLSTAVVDLTHLVKMQPSPDRADLDLDEVPEEVIDDAEPELNLPEPEKRRGYLSSTSRGSMTESVYSTTTGPRASTRLQTLPSSTYSAPQPPQLQGTRRPSASYNSSPAREPSGPTTNGTGLRRPSMTSQSNGMSSHRQQPSYASQASSQGGARRPSFTRDYSNGSNDVGAAQHRPQPSFTSQSSYNSQQSGLAPPSNAPRSNDRPGLGSTNNAFNERFNTISPQGTSLTGPGAGPGPLSPIPATPSNPPTRFGSTAAQAPGAGGLGVANPRGLSLAAPTTPGPDVAAADLAVTLDEESAAIIDSIQALVTAIRTSQPPDLIRTRAATVANILERILNAAQSAVKKSSQLANSPVARIVENLSMAQRRLGVADENAGSVIERGEEKGDAWREVVRVFPPVAFEVAREVRELGAKVKELGRGGAGDESEDDFR